MKLIRRNVVSFKNRNTSFAKTAYLHIFAADLGIATKAQSHEEIEN